MPLIPIKDLKEYQQLKDSLKERFKTERTGEQDLFREESKIFDPLIKKQEEATKSLGEKIVAGQDITSQSIVPFTRELKRRNDQFEMLQEQPFNQSGIDLSGINQSLPISESSPIKKNQYSAQELYDFNVKLNDSDKIVLESFKFALPSEVYYNDSFDAVFKRIKNEKTKITNTMKKTEDEGLRQTYNNQYASLDKYRKTLKELELGKEYISKQSTGKGLKRFKKRNEKLDIIPYNSVNDLLGKLSLFCAEKQGGHTGVDNSIVSILDELLRIKAIDKNKYKNLNKKILH